MIDINDVGNYKPCKRKRHEVWLCKPPNGTWVFNKLFVPWLVGQLEMTAPKIAAVLKGRQFLMADEMAYIAKNNAKLYQFLSERGQTVNSNQFAVCGTQGEMFLLEAAEVYNTIAYATTFGDIGVQQLIAKKGVNVNGEVLLDWYKVFIKQDIRLFYACFVSVDQSGTLPGEYSVYSNYNNATGAGVDHGRGDFVVCHSSINNKPCLAQRFVCNGLVFADTFNNRGWGDALKEHILPTIEKPATMWKTTVAQNNSVDKRKEKIYNWFVSHNLVEVQKACLMWVLNIDLRDEDISEIETCLSVVDSVFNMSKRLGKSCSFASGSWKYFLSKAHWGFTDEESGLLLLEFTAYLTIEDCVTEVRAPQTLFGWATDGFKRSNLNECYKRVENVKDVEEFIKTLTTKIADKPYVWLKRCAAEYFGKESSVHEALLQNERFWSGCINQYKGSLHSLQCLFKNVSTIFKKYGKTACGCHLDYEQQTGSLFLSFEVDIAGLKERLYFGMDLNAPLSTIVTVAYSDVSGRNYDEAGDLDADDYDSYEAVIQSIRDEAEMLKQREREREEREKKETDAFMHILSDGGSVWGVNCKKYHFYTEIPTSLQEFFAHIARFCSEDGNFKKSISYKTTSKAEVMSGRDCLEFKDFMGWFFALIDEFCKRYIYARAYLYTTQYSSLELPPYLEVCEITKTKRAHCFIHYPNGGNSDVFVLPINISTTTLELLQYEIPEYVKMSLRAMPSKYKWTSMHYYQVVSRMGLMQFVYNIKRLKQLYMEYNTEIFDDHLAHQAVISVYNYNASSADNDTAIAFTAPSCDDDIRFNAEYVNMQGNISVGIKCTMIHEMCHSWVVWKWGTCVELPGEDGHSVYNLSERHKDQWCYHGKRFGEAVAMASQKAGHPFGAIFGYGLTKGKYIRERVCGAPVLTPKNAFNMCQFYRRLKKPLINAGGAYDCECTKCGKLYSITRNALHTANKTSQDYYDPIDDLGLIALTPCECGGQLRYITNDEEVRGEIAQYFTDLSKATDYVSSMLQLCNANKAKYENYFKTNYNCTMKIYRQKMPILCIDITDHDGFNEMYKLFVGVDIKGRTLGRLYKDYGAYGRGVLLHEFRIDTKEQVLSFFAGVMTHVKKDLQQQ